MDEKHQRRFQIKIKIKYALNLLVSDITSSHAIKNVFYLIYRLNMINQRKL
jgi:hypothetical protein